MLWSKLNENDLKRDRKKNKVEQQLATTNSIRIELFGLLILLKYSFFWQQKTNSTFK